MSQPASYTPLESLLLFQSLLNYGVDNFGRISELLTNNSFIKDAETYDPTRLSPDALKGLFLRLLRDEINDERTDGAVDGSASPNSRKRKLGSPPLPTLRDVYENIEKIPPLVDRLYARYKDSVAKQIREDEARIEQVQKEISLLERTDLERRARAASQNGTPVLAPRDAKTVNAPNRPSPTPVPTPNTAATPATAKRVPISHTPVIPPKPPTPHIAPSSVVAPSHLPTGATPIRPTPSPKPPNGTGSVLQAPPGAPQAGPRPLQPPPTQPQKQSPRPEVSIKPKDGSAPPQGATPAAGALKWEKPYQPPQATPTPPRQLQSPVQQGIAPPPGQHPHPQMQHMQQHPHQQHLQQQPQQQWYPQGNVQYPQNIAPAPPAGQALPPPQQANRLPQHAQHPPPQPPHAQQGQRIQPQPQGQQVHPQAQHPQQYPQQLPNVAPHPAQPLRAQNAQHPRPQQAGKPVLVSPPTTGQLAPPIQPAPPRPASSVTGVQPPQVPPGRPVSTTPVHPPQRPIQPPQPQAQQAQQAQLAQKPQQTPNVQQQAHPHPVPRPIASASPTPPPGATGAIVPPQRWPQGYPPQQQAQQLQQQQLRQATPTSAAPAPQAAPKDKPYASPYVAQPPRPAIPERMIRQAVTTPARRASTPSAPHTPTSTGPAVILHGFGTRWTSESTPSTPQRPLSTEPPESPAFEPMSPPQQSAALPGSTSKAGGKKPAPKSSLKTEAAASKPTRGRLSRGAQKGRGVSATPSLTRTRRSQSVLSHTEEPPAEQASELATIIKNEEATPRPVEEAGDTTADESVHGRPSIVTPSSVSSRLHKRKRQDTPTEAPPPTTHVLWTRGFTKVSSSALDQISSHRDANMFATALRERDAPGYHQIVLQPQDITSIRSAIKHGNKAAAHAVQNLPGGDPGSAHVWLPISEELVPPKGIINSAQLERELVHMFCNAIMYNPDPDRGPGTGFLKRSPDEEEEVVGYRLDENGVVKNTRSMFVEVEKLLGDLRSAEKERSAPPPSATRPASVATPAEDTADEDDTAAEGEAGSGTVKRRRIGNRG